MADIGDHFLGPGRLERVRGIAERARRIDDVVDQHADAAIHVAAAFHDFRFAGLHPPLLADGPRGVVTQPGPGAGGHSAEERRVGTWGGKSCRPRGWADY